jgi:hypothetical protein
MISASGFSMAGAGRNGKSPGAMVGQTARSRTAGNGGGGGRKAVCPGLNPRGAYFQYVADMHHALQPCDGSARSPGEGRPLRPPGKTAGSARRFQDPENPRVPGAAFHPEKKRPASRRRGLDSVGIFAHMVGTRGFEPPSSCTPSKRANQAAPRPDTNDGQLTPLGMTVKPDS